MTQTNTVQKSSNSTTAKTPVQKSAGAAGGGRKVQMVAGAASFAEGEAMLTPRDGGSAPPSSGGRGGGAAVQMEEEPTAPAADNAAPAADGQQAGAGGDGQQAAPGGDGGAGAGADAEEQALSAAGQAALAALPAANSGDEAKTPGKVGQGEVGKGGGMPDWFMELQGRLVATTTWGEPEEAGQVALKNYAMWFAKKHSKDGKVPDHIAAFFEYIGRGSKNDTAARKAGKKGTSDLTGAAGAKNWCAGAATQAQRIGQKQGRQAVLDMLASKGLEPSTMPTIFFSNLATLSGSSKGPFFYGEAAYALPLEPGDRVDYLFDGCQYGGHAVHVVADLGDTFMHVSGNTTRHSAVATGAAKRCKQKPPGLVLGKACQIDSDAAKQAASAHIASVSFGGGALTYSVSRQTDPYKALSMLETDDPAAFEAALKKLCLKRGKQAPAPAAEPAAQGGGAAAAPSGS